MQAINAIQNSMINANARIQSGVVVGAANGHRAYLPCFTRSREAGPVVMRPELGSMCSQFSPLDASDSKQSRLRRDSSGQEQGAETLGLRDGRIWRLEADHQLPSTAWAMLVLNRTLESNRPVCG
jgi:hypothetical protein